MLFPFLIRKLLLLLFEGKELFENDIESCIIYNLMIKVRGINQCIEILTK